jgi:hypothetical protein
MIKLRVRYQNWLETYLRPRFPDLEAPLLEAFDACDEIEESGEVSEENLARLLRAMNSHRRPLYENICGCMEKLSVKFEPVQSAILEMSRSTKAHVRFNAILCLGYDTPHGLTDTVLKSGLMDKSARVRAKAGDYILRLDNKRVLPELSEAHACEKNPGTRDTLAFGLKLVRDGYILEKKKTGSWYVTVSIYRGGITCRPVDPSDIEAEGIEKVVAKIKRDKSR